jgi:hypothetical protein
VLGDEDFAQITAEGASMNIGKAVSCAAAFASLHC